MKRHGKESGFAMLLVFLMAACVAIMLYTELPRVSFEAERQRELLLVDRGNQFKRAIQVFVTDKVNNPTRRYPASIDELESFNNHRYLRHRYVDPMTGKDEWRLVHINGGVLTDSVTTQANANNKTQSASASPASSYISEQPYLGDTGAGGQAAGGATRALTRRPSDAMGPGGTGDPGMSAGGSMGMQGNAGGMGAPGMPTPGAPGLPGIPSMPGQTGMPMPGQPGAPYQPGIPPGMPGATPIGGQQGSQQQQNCTAYIGSCTPTNAPTTTTTPGFGQGGQQVPAGFPALQGPQGNQVAGGGMPGGMPGGGPGFGQPGTPDGQTANTAAASMIQGLLTSPRPGGMPTNMPGSTIGGGIAGVASKFEAEGIMVINDRTAINEWEYIFDYTKYRVPPNPVSGTVGTPQQPMGAGGPGGGTPGGATPMGPAAPGMGGGRGQ